MSSQSVATATIAARNAVSRIQGSGRGANLRALRDPPVLSPHLPQKLSNLKDAVSPELSKLRSTPSDSNLQTNRKMGAGRGSLLKSARNIPSNRPDRRQTFAKGDPRPEPTSEAMGLSAAVLNFRNYPSKSSPHHRRRSKQRSYENSNRQVASRSPVASLVPAALDPLHGGNHVQRNSVEDDDSDLFNLDEFENLDTIATLPARSRRARITAALKSDPSIEAFRAPDESGGLVDVPLTEGMVKVGDEAPPFAWGDLSKVFEHLPDDHWARSYVKGVVHAVQFNHSLEAGQKERMLAVVLQTLSEVSLKDESNEQRFQDAED